MIRNHKCHCVREKLFLDMGNIALYNSSSFFAEFHKIGVYVHNQIEYSHVTIFVEDRTHHHCLTLKTNDVRQKHKFPHQHYL